MMGGAFPPPTDTKTQTNTNVGKKQTTPLSPCGRGAGGEGAAPRPKRSRKRPMSEITCFKAYDIRGQLGTQLDEDIAYRIARGFAQWLKPRRVVLGGDIRQSSEPLKAALANGLRDE